MPYGWQKILLKCQVLKAKRPSSASQTPETRSLLIAGWHKMAGLFDTNFVGGVELAGASVRTLCVQAIDAVDGRIACIALQTEIALYSLATAAERAKGQGFRAARAAPRVPQPR